MILMIWLWVCGKSGKSSEWLNFGCIGAVVLCIASFHANLPTEEGANDQRHPQNSPKLANGLTDSLLSNHVFLFEIRYDYIYIYIWLYAYMYIYIYIYIHQTFYFYTFVIYLSSHHPIIHQVHKIQQGGEERYVLDAIIGEGMKSTKCLGTDQSSRFADEVSSVCCLN